MNAYKTALRNVAPLLILTVFVLTMLAIPSQTEAQMEQRCFSETGYCIEGSIRIYWEQNGGLAVFGYPITELRQETVEGTWTGPVQWFERDRLEDHGTQGVMAGRLGARVLELRNQPWWGFPTVGSGAPGCLYFPVTSHSLCEPFKSYWERRGGLERFGYPITEPLVETIENWTGTVQYFERRRMEHHTELSGTAYEVLLGLLGRDVLNMGAACKPVLSELDSAYRRVNFANDMGCPTDVLTNLPAAIQNMQNGLMIWVKYSDTDRKIYAIWPWGRYKTYTDTWQEGMPETPNVQPPDGFFAPRRGFGKAWIDDPSLRVDIGWAVEQTERAETATVQKFDRGLLIWLLGSDTVYALGPNEWNAQILSRQ